MPAHRKLVMGRGVNDAPFPTSLAMQSYRLWNNILSRCYGVRTKANVCYEGCEMDPSWFSYMTFVEWYDAHHRDGWELEKDLLVPGNKVYGPDTCVFVPHYLNLAITKLDSKGYSVDKRLKIKPYIVMIGDTYIGGYATPEEAWEAWAIARANHLLDVHDRYIKEPGFNWQVAARIGEIAVELTDKAIESRTFRQTGMPIGL